MKKIMDILEKAQGFIQKNGLDIDNARYEFHFGSLSIDGLLGVLKRYQNSDGGFFGLERDIAAPQSNPFAVEDALLICLWANVSVDAPLLQKTAAYLAQTQDEDGGWPFTPEIYEYKLAP